MSQQRNPRYWASRWYTTKFAKKPWPAGWYWHDERYDWSGPYDTEEEARKALGFYVESQSRDNLHEPLIGRSSPKDK